MILADLPSVAPVNAAGMRFPPSVRFQVFLMSCAGGTIGIALVVIMIQGNVTGYGGVLFIIVGQRKMVGHFCVIIIFRVGAGIPQAPVVAEVTVGKIQGAVLCQLTVDAIVHFTAVDFGVWHGLFVSVHIFVMQLVQIGTSAGCDPAPAFACSFQLGVPAPGVVGSPGRFKFKIMVGPFFCDDIDRAAGGIIIQKSAAGCAVQNFNAFDGHDGRGHI